MGKRTGIVVVSVAAAVLAAASFFFAFRIRAESRAAFAADGYLLSEGEAGAPVQAYFRAGTRYREGYGGEVAFESVRSGTVRAESDSFVHYTDQSMAALQDGVVLGLDGQDGPLTYYAVSPRSVMERGGEGYSLDNLGTPIRFGDFIWKIGDAKYLVASDQIELRVSSQETVELSGYIEASYEPDGVLRITSPEGEWRTLWDGCRAALAGGASVNLGEKTISRGETVLLSLDQMAAAGAAAVEVLPGDPAAAIPQFEIKTIDGKNGDDGEEGEEGEVGEEGEEGEEGDKGDKGDKGDRGDSGQDGGSGSGGGTVGGGGSGGSGGGTDTDGKVLPAFTLESFTATPSGMTATVHIEDEEGLLTEGGRVYYTVQNNQSGEVVFDSREETVGGWDTSELVKDIAVEGLAPDTSYRLTIVAPYGEGQGIEREFLNKMFVTDSVGLELVKNYAQTDALAVNVVKKAYSRALSFELALYGPDGNEVGREAGVFTDGGRKEVVFRDLDSNTAYTAKLEGIRLEGDSGSLHSGHPDSALKASTLKRRPVVGTPEVLEKNKTNSFEFVNRGVSDPDKGIARFRYEVYAYADPLPANASPLRTVTSEDPKGAEIQVDGVNLLYGYDYVGRVVAEFYDNEKTVEIVSGVTGAFRLDGGSWPVVGFEPDENFHDAFTGTLTVEMPSNNIVVDDDNPLTIVIQDTRNDVSRTYGTFRSLDEIREVGQVNANSFTFPVSADTLAKDRRYVISVHGTVKTVAASGTEPDANVLIGSATVSTLDVRAFKAALASVGNNKDGVRVLAGLAAVDPVSGAEIPDSREQQVLHTVSISLYRGVSATTANYVTKAVLTNTNTLPGGETDRFNSSLDALLFGGADYVITKETFPEIVSGIKPFPEDTATIVIGDAADYAGNEIPIERGSITFGVGKELPPLPVDTEDCFEEIVPLRNSAADLGAYGLSPDAGLSPSAIVGALIQPSYFDASGETRRFDYQLRDKYDGVLATIQNLPAVSGGTAPRVPVLFGMTAADYQAKLRDTLQSGAVTVTYAPGVNQLTRGRIYRFSYQAWVHTVNGAGVEGEYQYPDIVVDAGQPVPTLLSREWDVPKLDPAFACWPVTSDDANATWGYRVEDPDGAVAEHAQFGISAPSGATIAPAEVNTQPGDHMVVLQGLTVGRSYALTAQKMAYLYPADSGNNKISDVALFSGVFEGLYTLPGGITYTVTPDPLENRMRITAAIPGDSQAALAALNRIAALKVTVSAPDSGIASKTVYTAFDSAGNRNAGIPYTSIEEFIGQTLSFSIQALYDGGASGVGVEDDTVYYAVQQIREGGFSFGDYVTMNGDANGILTNAGANRSAFMVGGRPLVNLHSLIESTFRPNLGLSLGPDGIRSSTQGGSLITLKRLEPSPAGQVDSVSFSSVLPSYNLYYGNRETADITASPSGAVMKFELKSTRFIDEAGGARTVTVTVTPLKDVSSLTPDPSKPVVERELTIDAANPDKLYELAFEGLEPGTYYRVSFQAMVEGRPAELYKERPKDQQREIFRTTDMVNIQISSFAYAPASYAEKTFRFSYTLDQTMGFKLCYDLYGVDADGNPVELEGLEYPADVGADWYGNLVRAGLVSRDESFLKEMEQRIKCSPDDDSLGYRLAFDGQTKYRLVLQAYTPDGGTRLGTASRDFTPPLLEKPYAVADFLPLREELPDGTADSGLRFSLLVSDGDHAVVGDQYLVRFCDEAGADRTPEAYKGAYTVDGQSRSFELGGLVPDQEYTIRVYGALDRKNEGGLVKIEDIPEAELGNYELYRYAGETLNTAGVRLGTVSASQSSAAPGRIRLAFSNAVGLDRIKTLTYSVYNISASLSDTQTVDFTPVSVSAGQAYFDLPSDILTANGTYNIQANFYGEEAGEPVAAVTTACSYWDAPEAKRGVLQRLADLFRG